ncbi:ABC-2 type transport system permease protein [Parasporobacterium paucivorans DSM 15970]|uniref:Transport permease protein n=1 Tax=Parasporobacterium paucivorans DSM 15970 TaxID=1122934 RepID=A0A1M6JUD1_9FIRM|nr:ABC-2 type transport system permease protein [Parasporobacterium paucivorans DSM 15970]
MKIKVYISNFMQYKLLLKELVLRDVKIKYRRSVLGLLWTLLNPLLMMIVLTIVFSNMFRFDIDNFPVYLMCGQVIFNFFSEASSTAMSSIIFNAPLIKKIYVPKYLFPLSKVLSCFVNLVSSVIALVIVMFITKTPITGTVVLFFIPVIYALVFSIGMGVLLSSLAVSFRDIMHLYGVLITAWMYLTPIFYPISMLPDFLKTIIMFNPLASFVEMFRDVILYGNIPSWSLHLRCFVPCLIVLVLGVFVFKRQQDEFVLKI